MQKMLDYDQEDLSCLADILCLQCLAAEILDIEYCRVCLVHNADGQSRVGYCRVYITQIANPEHYIYVQMANPEGSRLRRLQDKLQVTLFPLNIFN